MLLNELNPGDKAEIIDCICNETSVKLMEMGIIRGEIIEVHDSAPLGDPMRIRVMDSEVSLRAVEAKNVIVKKL